MIPGFVTHTIADIGNQLLRLDPASPSRLASLAGKVVLVDCISPTFKVYFIASADAVRMAHDHEGPHHAAVRGTLGALMHVARPGASEDPASFRELEVEGDTEIARQFLALSSRLDIDWEEQASQVVGDEAAHHLGNLLRALNEVGPRAVQVLLHDVGDYLQYEARFTPPRSQVAAFLEAVDILRGDVDRLEQRVRLLQGEQY